MHGYLLNTGAVSVTPDREGAGILARALVAVELEICLLLVFPCMRLYGLLASFSLLVLFTSYLGYMVLYTPQLPCSCGGVISSLSWKEHVYFNLFILLVTAAALYCYPANCFCGYGLPAGSTFRQAVVPLLLLWWSRRHPPRWVQDRWRALTGSEDGGHYRTPLDCKPVLLQTFNG